MIFFTYSFLVKSKWDLAQKVWNYSIFTLFFFDPLWIWSFSQFFHFFFVKSINMWYFSGTRFSCLSHYSLQYNIKIVSETSMKNDKKSTSSTVLWSSGKNAQNRQQLQSKSSNFGGDFRPLSFTSRYWNVDYPHKFPCWKILLLEWQENVRQCDMSCR